jgi:uncharacterized protein
MKTILLTLFLFFSTHAQAQAPLELTRLDKNLKPIKLKISKIENLNFAGACLSQPPCKALVASRVKYPPKPKKVVEGPPREELLGHPAAQYCLQTGGRNIFLTDAKSNQYDYCLFEDESLVDSWSMYWKHHPQ